MFVRVSDNPFGTRHAGGRGPAQRSFEIHSLEGGRHHLKVWGRLPRRWADSLCRGLARQGIAVVRGSARRGEDGEWTAGFELAATAEGAHPMLVDYLALALRPPPGATPAPIAIEHYHLAVCEGDGALALEVLGPDQLGFLGGLLERLSFLSLVPVEMEIETGPGGIRDRFRLQTPRGDAPTAATRRILAEVLAGRLCTGVAAAS